MKTITKKINLYTFDELPEDIQDTIVENHCYINTDMPWYMSIVDEAEDRGIRISEMDVDNPIIKGKAIGNEEDIAKSIIENHTPDMPTYKTAESFLNELKELRLRHTKGRDIDADDLPYDEYWAYEGERQKIADSLIEAILIDYLTIFKNEYKRLTSREAIINTIRNNECYFDENGTIYYI